MAAVIKARDPRLSKQNVAKWEGNSKEDLRSGKSCLLGAEGLLCMQKEPGSFPNSIFRLSQERPQRTTGSQCRPGVANVVAA